VRGVTIREERPGSYQTGTTIVELVLNEGADVYIFRSSPYWLEKFAPEGKQVYLAVGEVQVVDRKSASVSIGPKRGRRSGQGQLEEPESDKYSRLLGEGSITLTPEEIQQLRDHLTHLRIT